jgi:hypothetical protein
VKHEWMDDARCDSDAAWVTEYGMFSPPAEVLARLQAVCLECPVIRDCARYAIANRLEGQFCAGVFLPLRNSSSGKRDTAGYLAAVRLLERRVAA